MKKVLLGWSYVLGFNLATMVLIIESFIYLLGGKQAVVSTATDNRNAPTNSAAVTSITTRPAGSNARYRFRSSGGRNGGSGGAQRSSNTG